MSNNRIRSLACNDDKASHRIVGCLTGRRGYESGILGYYSREYVATAMRRLLAEDPEARLRVEPHNSKLFSIQHDDKILRSTDVEWIISDLGELGVKIQNQFFFLYKGESLMYNGEEDSPQKYRLVMKREFEDVIKTPIEDYKENGVWMDIDHSTAVDEIRYFNEGEE